RDQVPLPRQRLGDEPCPVGEDQRLAASRNAADDAMAITKAFRDRLLMPIDNADVIVFACGSTKDGELRSLSVGSGDSVDDDLGLDEAPDDFDLGTGEYDFCPSEHSDEDAKQAGFS